MFASIRNFSENNFIFVTYHLYTPDKWQMNLVTANQRHDSHCFITILFCGVLSKAPHLKRLRGYSPLCYTILSDSTHYGIFDGLGLEMCILEVHLLCVTVSLFSTLIAI